MDSNSQISFLDLMWLSSYLDGEGCFQAKEYTNPRTGYTKKHVSIGLSGVDVDVVSRAATIMGSNLCGPHLNGPVNKCKLIYTTHVTRRVDVRTLCMLLLPHMGLRRQKKIKEILCLIESWGQPRPGHVYKDIIPFTEDPVPPPITGTQKEADVCWISGLAEGEGYFRGKKYLPTDHDPGGRKVCQIKIAMTDKDVVSRAASILGVAVYGPYTPKKVNHKKYYVASVERRSEVKRWCSLLYPHMGLRRQRKILEVLHLIRQWGPSLRDKQK